MLHSFEPAVKLTLFHAKTHTLDVTVSES